MIGRRLFQARTEKCLTYTQLSSELETEGYTIPPSAISAIENGRHKVSSGVVLAIASLLDKPVEFFFKEIDSTVEWGNYRRKTGLPEYKADSIKAMAEQHAEVQARLMALLLIDASFSKLPKYPITRPEEAEFAAVEFRDYLGMTNEPIGSMVSTLEDQYFIVFLPGLQNDSKFDGLSGLVDMKHAVIVSNHSVPADRLRFTLAHELGHLLLECESSIEERAAMRFAGAFLIPNAVMRKSHFERNRSYISLIDKCVELKHAYGISIQAIMYRCKDLCLIQDSLYKKSCTHINRMGWKTKEPTEISFEEKPMLRDRLLKDALKKNMISQLEAYEINPDVIEERIPDSLKKKHAELQRLLSLPFDEREKELTRLWDEAAPIYAAHPELRFI